MTPTTVMRMHSALTQMGVIPALATLATLEMDTPVQVSSTLSILREYLRGTALPPPPCFSQDFLHTVISSNLCYLSVSCHELLRRTCG